MGWYLKVKRAILGAGGFIEWLLNGPGGDY